MKELPPLPPEVQGKVDQFYAGCAEMLDRYAAAVELDMNRHAVKHGPMPQERMVYDFTQVLYGQLNSGELKPSALCGMVAMAISREIVKKRKGKA